MSAPAPMPSGPVRPSFERGGVRASRGQWGSQLANYAWKWPHAHSVPCLQQPQNKAYAPFFCVQLPEYAYRGLYLVLDD
jgi:hypothetical protein